MQYDKPAGTPRVGILVVQVSFFACRSLKEKRSRMRRLLKDLHDMNLSASEVGDQDAPGRGTVACVRVGSDWRHVESRLHRVEDTLHDTDGFEVRSSRIERLI